MIAVVLWLYRLGFYLYPRKFRDEFADEMTEVFSDVLVRRANQGRQALLVTGLQELYQLPAAVVRLHWRAWRKQHPKLLVVRVGYRSPFHRLPFANDGRFSVRQALLETLSFILIGGGLFTITYIQPVGIPIAWQHQWYDASAWVALIALPIFIIGLLGNLPRWAYPAGGLLIGHTLFTAGVQSLFIFWICSLLIAFSLLLTAVYIHLHRQSLTPFLVRIGQSLASDWTRTAFGFYSMTPYVIISAFDDTYLNNQTAFFALALLVMILGAAVYCRSKRQERQFGILVGGITGILVIAGLEQLYLDSHSLTSLVGLITLWTGMLTLFLLPMLASLIYRGWIENRTTQTRG